MASKSCVWSGRQDLNLRAPDSKSGEVDQTPQRPGLFLIVMIPACNSLWQFAQSLTHFLISVFSLLMLHRIWLAALLIAISFSALST